LRKLYLTFDVEDHFHENAIKILRIILEKLDRHKLKGIFFITGLMAEKLAKFPDILDMLGNHEIGYHSSAHSVKPQIFEFTDVKNYEEAYLESLKRETSHVNPTTGITEGEGGIVFLKKLFPQNKVVAYRAPGNCWSPPHFEALVKLGIRFDFSLYVSVPTNYKGVTFYPYTTLQHWEGKLTEYKILVYSLLKYKYITLGFHPCLYANEGIWDSIYMKKSLQESRAVKPRSTEKIKSLMTKIELLFTLIKILEKLKLTEVTPTLTRAQNKLELTKKDVEKWYVTSMRWASFFGYKPKFIRDHFFNYFDDSLDS